MTWHVDKNLLPRIAAKMPEKVDAVVGKVAHDLQADAQQRAPFDTGNLAGSAYTRKVGPYTYRVGFSAEYALYVEMGTRRMRAQPYMVPAWLAARFRLMQALRRLEL